MGKYLRDISIYVDFQSEPEFVYSKNFLETLYIAQLPKVETKSVSKANVVPCRALPQFLVVFHRGEVVAKKLVTTVKPGDYWIRAAVRPIEWSTNSLVKLISPEKAYSCELTLPV